MSLLSSSRRRSRRRACVGAAAGLAVAAGLALVPVASAQSVDVVIAEVYGGGGNSGATLTTDFVTLGNRGAAEVAVDDWSVQYLTASPGPTSRWQVTSLTGSVEAGGRFLIAQSRGAGGSVELPAPDAVGSIPMSASTGTVALVRDVEPLTCRTVADCAEDERIVDLVGWGSAEVREGTPAPATNNTSSVRRDAELTDTDDNAADFTVGTPAPVNSAGEAPGEAEEPEVPPGPEEPGELRIHDIQGVTRTSPHLGDEVEGVPGVVTAVGSVGSARGFWFQDVDGDGDERTSEGLFVFTGDTTPDVAVGDEILVSGRVDEYRAGGQAGAAQSITQLAAARWTVLSGGNPLPEAELLDADAVPLAQAPSSGGDIEGLELEPAEYALDFYASRESMVVRVVDAPVVGPTDAYSALWVTTKPDQNRSERGGTVYQGYDDANTGRLKIESLIPSDERAFPIADVGDELAGVTEGPLYYSQYGGYLIRATSLGEHVSGGLTREVTRSAESWELAVATYNVENLSPADDQEKFDRLASGVVENLASPDIVALEEIQDDSGPTDDGVVSAAATLDQFAAAIVAAGGPDYEWRQIDPNDKQDGGQPGGNIRVAFLFDPERVSFVDTPGGDADTAVAVTTDEDDRAALSVSPGRIDPADAAWADSRKPLVGQFQFEDRNVFVVANHFASKGGDQALHGRFQPPNRSSEVQRLEQAAAVRGFVDEVARVDPAANVLVVGDLNDFQFSPVLGTLTESDVLINPMNGLPATERYGYVFDGNSQALDHLLVSGNLSTRADYDPVRINAEFADQASDHDPQIVRFRPLSGDAEIDAAEEQEYYGSGGSGGDDDGADGEEPVDQATPPGGAPGTQPPALAGATGLANTGAAGTVWLVVAAVVLLAGGGTALVLTRRRKPGADEQAGE
ncbi:endonuclease/exonuclease/phosphatase family protein [Actinoalloteichus fjordicus]|uniref:Extracellular nuclease n=1 Tax=Actinoalloteichus fjordicus TaxID=1612552 RepID=A0AAC9L6H1_9PSEU|nr:endonuclease/exonuclease/phosphatase family protein [Actinoalloteichus fjordicus]APU12273.1 putative extracellular nuclease [Actinoalloteichus fjordicus]